MKSQDTQNAGHEVEVRMISTVRRTSALQREHVSPPEAQRWARGADAPQQICQGTQCAHLSPSSTLILRDFDF